MKTYGTVFALSVAAALSGCATLSPDGGVGAANELLRDRGITTAIQRLDADEADDEARVVALLAQPLTPDAAVEIAMRRNAGFRARIAQLAVADAERVQAGRLANPTFAFSDKRGPEIRTIERALTVNVLALVTLPLGQELADRRFEDAQLRLAGEALSLAAETRRAWIRSVAATEQLQYFEQANDVASTGAELADRMRAVGNYSQLQRLREQAFAADTAAALARARHSALAERERLTRLMGLWGANADYRLPARLPELPSEVQPSTQVERTAIGRRVDVLAARRGAEATAAALQLSRITRFVNVLHVGYVNESERGEPRADGYEVELELPLFDFGDAKHRRAEALYLSAVERTREVAVNARSEVRERFAAYRTAYDLARHYRDRVVPARKAIAEEMLLRYNGMLVGIFELLADAREQIASVNRAIEATRDFWLAESQLQQSLVAGTPSESALSTAVMAPASAAGGH